MASPTGRSDRSSIGNSGAEAGRRVAESRLGTVSGCRDVLSRRAPTAFAWSQKPTASGRRGRAALEGDVHRAKLRVGWSLPGTGLLLDWHRVNASLYRCLVVRAGS